MSSANPGHGAAASSPEARSVPVARVSASAIARNARIAAALIPAGSLAIADLRADAWGHGAPEVSAELLAAGIDRLIVDDPPATRAGADARDQAAHAVALDTLTLYGLPGGAADATPALRLSGTVLSVKRLLRGEGVSYGYLHRADADTRVALVTGGYAQGVVRELGGRVDVAIAGRRHPIIGRVAMDVCVVDVGEHEVRRGDEVVFFGDPGRGEPSLRDWLDATSLGAAEIVTAIGLRAWREAVA